MHPGFFFAHVMLYTGIHRLIGGGGCAYVGAEEIMKIQPVREVLDNLKMME